MGRKPRVKKSERLVNVMDHLLVYEHDDFFIPKLPQVPTQHPAGSLEKIEVMRMRVLRGEHLWHPDDSRKHVQLYHRPQDNRDYSIRIFETRKVFSQRKGVFN
jgi:hypothetical protein